MKRMLASLMAPLPEADEVRQCRQAWLEALGNASDLVQSTRCGRVTLLQISERLAQLQLPKDKHGQAVWARELQECGRNFIEQCAEIVEVCSASPKLSSSVLGSAVRLAEAVGSTGPLVAAMELELAAVAGKVRDLEVLYDVAITRVETVAGEVPALEANAADAQKRAEEAMRRQAELQLECREAKKALKHSERRCLAAERKAMELTNQLRLSSRATRIAQKPSPAGRSAASLGTPIEDSLSQTLHEEASGQKLPCRYGSISKSSNPISAQLANFYSPAMSTFIQNPSNFDAQMDGDDSYRMQQADPLMHGATERAFNEPIMGYAQSPHDVLPGSPSPSPIEPDARREASQSPLQRHLDSFLGSGMKFFDSKRPQVGHGEQYVGQPHSGSALQLEASGYQVHAVASQEDRESMFGNLLRQGTSFASALSPDPMAASARAAFDHLSALLQQALEMYPSLLRQATPQRLDQLADMLDPVKGLHLFADHIGSWARLVLKVRDPTLSASVEQSAMHLRCLVGLLPVGR